jgi:hypothetical protein
MGRPLRMRLYTLLPGAPRVTQMLATHPRLESPPIPTITSQFLDCLPVELQRGIQSLEQDVSPRSRSIEDFVKNLEEIGMTSSSTSRPREEVSIRTEFELSQNFYKFAFSGDTETSFLLRSGYLIQVRKGEVPGWAYMDLSPKHDLQGYTPAPLEWKGVPRQVEGDGIMGWALDLDQDLVAVSLLP